MTQEEALQLIRGSIVTMSGLDDTKILIADGDLPRPSSPHISLRIRTDETRGYPERTGKTTLHENKILQIEAEAAGSSAIDALKITTARLRIANDPDGLALSYAGVGVQAIGNFSNISALLRSSKEPRESVLINFSYTFTTTVPEPLEATAIVLDILGNDTLEYTETFEIP